MRHQRNRININKRIYRIFVKLLVDCFHTSDEAVNEITASINEVNINPEPVFYDAGEEPEPVIAYAVPEPALAYAQPEPIKQVVETPEPSAPPEPSIPPEPSTPTEPVINDNEIPADNEVACPVCMETVDNEKLLEYVWCCYCRNPVHLVCRFNMAKHKHNKCPQCREYFEKDKGKEFNETYGITREKNSRRSGSLSCSSSRVSLTSIRQENLRLKREITHLLDTHSYSTSGLEEIKGKLREQIDNASV